MRKAVPRPVKSGAVKPEPWEIEIGVFDRRMRRHNRAFRKRVVRLAHEWVGLISSDRKLGLSRLNELEPVEGDF